MESRLLLARLDAIGQALSASHHALALIGLGSVGEELQRLDAYSDLDFFAIVAPGYKAAYLSDLQWLSAVSPIAYAFQNTVDGYKVLYADGIYCEFAVFEPHELHEIPFASGRIIWQDAQAIQPFAKPVQAASPPDEREAQWFVDEALTNLYVGLGRALRGETLSALRHIQVYAVDCLISLVERQTPAPTVPRDQFAHERRFEQRFPASVDEAAGWMQGYAGNGASASDMLAFLEAHFTVNAALALEIRERIHALPS